MQNGKTPTRSVASLISSNFKAMKSVLPKHLTAERMARIALIEVRRNPKLGQSDPASLIGAIMVASQLGLEPGIQGMGYLIPYYNSSRGCYEVQFQIGYRGMMDLARRSGGVGLITAEVVRVEDDFSYRLGTDPHIHHIPASGDRGPITHFYSVAKLVPSGHVQFRIMELAEVEKVRDLHSKSNSSKFSPWRDNFEEMGMKTLIRRNAKYLPTSPEFQKAISLDEMSDAGLAQNLALELPSDMELPADFQGDAAADQMETTADRIRADMESAEDMPNAGTFGPTTDDLDPEGTPVGDPVGEPVEQDDFDLMDRVALDVWLRKKKPEFAKGGKSASSTFSKMIGSAIKVDSLTVKRELARKLVENA